MASSSNLWMHLIAFRDRVHQDVVAEYTAHDTKIGQLVADATEASTSALLTPAGRVDAIEKRKDKARAEILPALRARLKTHDERLAQLREQALPARPTRDTFRQFAEFEIRQALRGNDPLQNYTHLLEAIENGDALTVSAIMEAPAFFKMLTTDQREEALRQLVAKSPVAGEISEVENSRAVHQALLEAIVQDIETAGAVNAPAPGPRAHASGGGSIEDLARSGQG